MFLLCEGRSGLTQPSQFAEAAASAKLSETLALPHLSGKKER